VQALEKAKARLESGKASADAGDVLAELHAELAALDTSKQLADQTKELHGAISKLGKASRTSSAPLVDSLSCGRLCWRHLQCVAPELACSLPFRCSFSWKLC
jgi:hypothetical protein